MMVRTLRGESERAMTLALTAVMTAISAVHQKAARALFRFRKLIAAGWHDLSATSRCLPRLAQLLRDDRDQRRAPEGRARAFTVSKAHRRRLA